MSVPAVPDGPQRSSASAAPSSPAMPAAPTAPGGLPGPPPGPGVQPPFVAPPTDGQRRRRAIAWWVAGVSVAVVCGGGVVGVGALGYLGTKAIEEQSVATVTEHLSAIQNQDFVLAYEQLCDRERQRHTVESYRRTWDGPRIETFTVDKPVISGDVVVPVRLKLVDKTGRVIHFRLEQDSSTGEYEVCGRDS